jgi:DNA-binding protein HU-beta
MLNGDEGYFPVKKRSKLMAKKATPKTKSEIMAALAAAAEISKKQAVTVYETLMNIAYAGAKDPKGIMLPGLGKLIKVKRPARTGRNPATGATIKIPAKTVAKFRLAKAAKDAVLSK